MRFQVSTHSNENRSVKKSPGLAVVFSLLVWPGVGHFYIARIKQGILWMTGTVVGWLLVPLAIGKLIIPIIYLAASWHSYLYAKRFNELLQRKLQAYRHSAISARNRGERTELSGRG